MRAVIYTRVSTKDQAEGGFSLDAQLRVCREYCQQQAYEVVGEFVDEGVSASKESASRPQFKRALAAIWERKAEVFVVHKLDRFSRDLNLTASIIKKLVEVGATLESVSEGLDHDTANGRLLIKIMASFAEFYSDNLATEVSKGRKERALQGLWNGDLPFGYDRGATARDAPAHNPVEAPLVLEAYRRYASGTCSFRDVADWLNTQQVSPRSKRGRTYFTEDSVRDMVRNPFYRGVVAYKGEEHPGVHEAIVDEATWYQCQATRRARQKAASAKTSRPSQDYLLRGLAFCSSCNGALWCQDSHGTQRYQDNARHRQHACKSSRASVKAEMIDRQIDEIFTQLNLPRDWDAHLQTLLAEAASDIDVARERKALTEKRDRVVQTWIDGHLSPAQYRAYTADIDAKLEALRAVPIAESIAAMQSLEGFGDVWWAATPRERHEMASLVFEAVYVDLEAAELVAVKPRRAFLNALRLLMCEMQWLGDPERIRTADLHLDRVAC